MSKGHFIGVVSPIVLKQDIYINENNIDGYFSVSNSSNYYFELSGGVFSSKCTHGETAQTTLIAVQDMPVSFDYKVSSELSCDIFTLTVAGTQIAEISGEKSGTWSGTLKAGDAIKLKYSKDNSISSGDDKAIVSNLKVNSLPTNAGPLTTITSSNIETYFEDGGIGHFWSKSNVQYLIQRSNYNGDGDSADALRLQAKSEIILSFMASFSLSYTENAYIQIGNTTIATINGGESLNESYSFILKKGEALVVGWSNTSSSPLYGTSVNINNFMIRSVSYTSSGSGQVARKITKEYLGVNGVARKVIVGKIGVDGIAREYMGDYGKLMWPPETYNTETGNSIKNSYSLQNGKAILECSGGFNTIPQSAGIVMHYKRAGQRLLLPAGTVINCNISVSHSGWADGGLLIVYTDGTTDVSGYNKTADVLITLSKPGYIQVEATRHSEQSNTGWDGTDNRYSCTTILTSLYIDGKRIFPE